MRNENGKLRLLHLTETLKQNQEDTWLGDFMSAPFSAKATDLLSSAVKANYEGDLAKAVKDASAAAILFRHVWNLPGNALSEYELVYAMRRQSKSKQCLDHASLLEAAIRGRSYRWLQLQEIMERSVCAGLLGHLDQAARLADNAVASASQIDYPSLRLRSLSLLASWHTFEGRFRQSWRTNEEGLARFWDGAFPSERGFQLYSDLELTAEHAELWYLAVRLQREVLAMINETGRVDFQATAHLHLATAAAATGADGEAQEEFSRAQALFVGLPQSQAVDFLRADSEIGIAQIEVEQKRSEDARKRLLKIEQAIAESGSFVVRLRYKKAWAQLSRQMSDTDQEWFALREAVGIAIEGYRTLKSDRDRWEWNHEVEEPYRRLLELEMERPHSPEQALADWELYKVRQSTGGAGFSNETVANPYAMQILRLRAKHLRDSSLLSFAVFPRWTMVWMVDDRGVHEARLVIASKDLRREIQSFYLSCSDPNAAVEKVKKEAFRLYRVLFAPVDGMIDPQRGLLVESDSALGPLPWAALMTENGSYLGERYRVLEIPGLFFGGRQLSTFTGRERLLVAAPGAVTFEGEHYPSPSHAEEEIDYMLGLYPNAIYLQNEEATAENLRLLLPTVSIFHFAGHAVSRTNGGELLVQGATTGDLFSSFTLDPLNLKKNQLVVLSACSTAIANGEVTRDPNGLVRAFLRAGAGQVIASEWEVNSRSTALLMRYFYSFLARYSDPARALQNARHLILARPDNSNPYYWASFELFGYMQSQSLPKGQHNDYGSPKSD